MRKFIILLVFLGLMPASLMAQNLTYKFAEKSNVLSPFVSDLRSPLIKTELLSINKLDGNYYLSDVDERPFIETHLGADITWLTVTSEKQNMELRMSSEIGSVVLVDMFEQTSAPVINNDYFFGLKIGLLVHTNHNYLKNIGLKLVPIFHESTHLGDEFVLHGIETVPNFQRINISYEAWEIAAVINDPDTLKSNLMSFKAGIHALWNPNEGYYFTDTLEVQSAYVPASIRNVEYYFQLNYQQTQGFLCSEKWMRVFSVEARNRVKFAYSALESEERAWSINAYLGYQYVIPERSHSLGLFFRYYYGVNPHGQMRNTDDFQAFGLSLIYR